MGDTIKTKEDVKAFVEELIGDKVKSAIEEHSEAMAGQSSNQIKELVAEMRSQNTKKELGKGTELAQFIRATAAAKGDPERAAKWVKDKIGEENAVYKALAASDFTAGGATVPQDFVADVIEFLRPSSAVRSLNPNVLPMPNGSLTLPKLTGGATAGYVSENANGGTTEPTFGDVKLTYKKLVALVPISNDFLRY